MGNTVILYYGKTKTNPGFYLERALRTIGAPVKVVKDVLDGRDINSKDTLGVIFVESPKQPKAKNMEVSGVPRLFWVHHGIHRLKHNLQLIVNHRKSPKK